MGEIVGAALVSHIPPIVWPDEARFELYGGVDTTLVAGLHALRTECFDRLDIDTVIVFDTHWYTTVEHIITAHERRQGLFTSDELPRAMASVPYDMQGDPELAQAVAALAAELDDTWVLACDEPGLPVHYPTINLLPFLQRDEAWLSVGICQTGTPADWLLFGDLLATAIGELDRRVVLLASGGLSHKFWPLTEFRQHETAELVNIITPQARSADEAVLARFERGDHAGVIDEWPGYRRHSPEGMFAHYLMMVGAIGGRDCAARGTLYGNYESAAGTGQANVWFERPEKGWTT
ncbi:MAG: catechol 1,2-dioxygenase [Ilumatobacteraceae bacterium]